MSRQHAGDTEGGNVLSKRDRDDALPRTVDEAVDRLIAMMSPDDLAQIRQMSGHDLIELHFSLGMAIRNRFGLWGDNHELMESCASVRAVPSDFFRPDSASGVIIEALWQRLQEQQ